MSKKRLVEAETRSAIIADYQAGKRVLDIEQEHGVSRATLYWVLDEAGVLPDRLNRGERLRGNTEDLRMLYELISAQEKHVELLEALLVELSATHPDVEERLKEVGLT
jgi:hypothetical protein